MDRSRKRRWLRNLVLVVAAGLLLVYARSMVATVTSLYLGLRDDSCEESCAQDVTIDDGYGHIHTYPAGNTKTGSCP